MKVTKSCETFQLKQNMFLVKVQHRYTVSNDVASNLLRCSLAYFDLFLPSVLAMWLTSVTVVFKGAR